MYYTGALQYTVKYLRWSFFCENSHSHLLMRMTNEQGVQGLQAFAFCVVTVNEKHTEPRFKRERAG